MGTVLLRPKDHRAVAADATVDITGGGKFVVSFPLDLSHLGLAPAGSVGTVYATSGAVANFPITGRGTTILPAGLSVSFAPGLCPWQFAPQACRWPGPRTSTRLQAGTLFASTNKTVTSTKSTTKSTTASKTFTVSTAVAALFKKLGLSLASPTLTGVLNGNTLTVSLPAPSALAFRLPAGVPAPVFGPTIVTVNVSTKTLTLDASATVSTVHPVGATLHVEVMNASTTAFTESTDLGGTITLTGVPFLAGTTFSLQGSIDDKAGTVAPRSPGPWNQTFLSSATWC